MNVYLCECVCMYGYVHVSCVCMVAYVCGCMCGCSWVCAFFVYVCMFVGVRV